MKTKITSVLILLFISTQLSAQYNINPNIQNNYEYDANVLALREILSNPSDPDYDNPIVPTARLVPYLEDLSAIYDNPENNPDIDSIFNFFDIHANQEYESSYNDNYYRIDFKRMTIVANTSDSWVANFKNTGVSGISALDNLISTYQFSLDSFLDLNTCSCTYFYIETNNDYMNLKALEDDFLSIPEITAVEVNFPDLSFRLNYTGMPYTIESGFPPFVETGFAEVSNITVNGDVYTFSIHGGDCFSGCTISESFTVSVDTNFNVLSNKKFSEDILSVYPNPASSTLTISSTNEQEVIDVAIFDISGKQVIESTSINIIDVSNLKTGMYLVKLSQHEKIEIKKLIIQ